MFKLIAKLSPFILTALISLNVQASTEINSQKKALIDTLLDQTNQSAMTVGKQLSESYIQQMISVLKQSSPNMNPKAFTIVEEEVKSIIKEELIVKKGLRQLMYPVYSKHFSVQDLEKMIEFNKTELGKKIINVMPLISQESMQAGQTFGQSLAPKVLERITARFQAEGIVM